MLDRRGHIVAGGLDGNLVVLLKVDATVAAGEQLALEMFIARTLRLPRLRIALVQAHLRRGRVANAAPAIGHVTAE